MFIFSLKLSKISSESTFPIYQTSFNKSLDFYPYPISLLIAYKPSNSDIKLLYVEGCHNQVEV